MKWMILAILILSCSSIYAHLCLSSRYGKYIRFSFEEIDVDDPIRVIKNGTLFRNENDSLCRLEFIINLDAKTLTMKFTKNFKISVINDRHVHIDSFIENSYNNQLTVRHFVEYACLGDLCDWNFLIKYQKILFWFRNETYRDFTNQVTPFIFNNQTRTHTCYDDDSENFTECTSGQCGAALMKSRQTQNQINLFCVNNNTIKLPGVQVQVVFGLDLGTMYYALFLFCKHDQCNNQNNLLTIQNIFNEKYALKEILDFFGVNSQIRINNNLLSGGNDNSTMNTTQTSTTLSNHQKHLTCDLANIIIVVISFIYLF